MPSEKVAALLAAKGIDVEDDEFAHYGVPGMKWGQRKASDSGSSSGSSSSAPKKAPAGSVERIHQDMKARGLVYDKKTNSYSSPGAKKVSSETAAKVRLAAAGKGAAISKSQLKADKKVIDKIAKRDAKLEGNRLKGVSRIVQYGGDKKKANRDAVAGAVGNIIKGSVAVGLTAGAISLTGGPGGVVAGVALVAALSATGKMSQTVRDIRNVNEASQVFNPNTLLNRSNNN